MPAVGDLNGVRQSSGGCLAITAPTIAGHDLDPGMVGETGLNCCDLAIWQ
jgi:hypothetical protein